MGSEMVPGLPCGPADAPRRLQRHPRHPLALRACPPATINHGVRCPRRRRGAASPSSLSTALARPRATSGRISLSWQRPTRCLGWGGGGGARGTRGGGADRHHHATNRCRGHRAGKDPQGAGVAHGAAGQAHHHEACLLLQPSQHPKATLFCRRHRLHLLPSTASASASSTASYFRRFMRWTC